MVEVKPKRLALAMVSLHVSTALYVVLGAGMVVLFAFVFPAAEPDAVLPIAYVAVLGGGCLLMAAGTQMVAWGLRRRRFWGWVAGIILFGLYVPSLFLPLGVLGLWGLLDPASRRLFPGASAGSAPLPPAA